MTAEEQIKRITDIVNELNLDEMTEDNMWVEMRGKSFNEIFDDMWELYTAIGDIVDVLNEQDETDD